MYYPYGGGPPRQGGNRGCLGFLFFHPFDQSPGFWIGTIFTVLLIVGVLFWFVLFNMDSPEATRILIVEICAAVICLLTNFYLICRRNYDGFLTHFKAMYILNVVCSVAGLYIAGVQLVPNTDGSDLIALWRFISFVFIAALMALVPTIVSSAIMWVIMSIFGTPRK